jgi:hypothetical protein
MPNFLDETGLTNYDTKIKHVIGNATLDGVNYITEAPTADNTNGKLIFVVLSSDPATKYDGYVYLILAS